MLEVPKDEKVGEIYELFFSHFFLQWFIVQFFRFWQSSLVNVLNWVKKTGAIDAIWMF